MFVLGIDVGTQGARVLVCGSEGQVVASAEHPFALMNTATETPGWFEQRPSDWLAATASCLDQVTLTLRQARIGPDDVRGISVASTSGTVCIVDDQGEVVGPAIMYNDRRAQDEATEVNRVGADLTAKLGYRFSSSYALPKYLWLKRHEPQRFHAARFFLSPTDFIIGWLVGRFGITDYNNALKMGYDLIEDRWPDFIETTLGIPRERLPEVVAPGTRVGTVSKAAAEATGLAAGTPVLAGTTDGCASQVSTGAVAPGQWSTTLGTTLVIKGVSRDLIRDPKGRVYCHRHPDGHWLPGGASNTGAECIARRFDAERLPSLNDAVLQRAPSDLIIYPLVDVGERFPFAHPQAEGFTLGDTPDEATLYTACLEGVGYVERLAYEMLGGLGAELGDRIFAAGGATRSSAWLQLRADILDKLLLLPADSGGAKGAAVVAASGTLHGGIVPAARAMVRIVKQVEPRAGAKAAYDERYARFVTACRDRGYID